MEWLLAPVVIAAIITALVTIWKTIYKGSNRPDSPPANQTGTNVIVNVGHDQPQTALPTDPGAGFVPTKIPLQPPIEPRTTRPAPRPAPSVNSRDFVPVAGTSRYEDLPDSNARQEALLKDLYRASEGGLRIEMPDTALDGETDS